MRIEGVVRALKRAQARLVVQGYAEEVIEIEHGLDAIQHLQACLLDAADEMSKATVFVTSRERIKRPEGVDYWLAAIEQIRIDAREMAEDGE